MKAPLVHLYDLDTGTIVCRGISLAEAACPMDEDPLRIVIDVEDTTCPTCKLRWKAQQKLKVVA